MIRPPPSFTLFPYTTLFRSGAEPIDIGLDEQTGRVFTADAHSDQVTIIDSATLEVENSLPVGGYPSGLTHVPEDRKSTRLNSSHVEISYAVFCLKKKKISLT